jgi:hypothetical protein
MVVHTVAGLKLPHTPIDHPLHRVLAAALPDDVTLCLGADQTSSTEPYWDARFFQLDQVTLFRQASAAEQANILARANQSLLEEAYWVEQAGVGYMAKMVLLAETLEERLLYGLFAADEATHLSQLSQFWLPPASPSPPNLFLTLLTQIAESNDKAMLLFVIQVILEGWGLSHYRRLAADCQDPSLASLFTHFLQAEARHHRTGSLLFNQAVISAASQSAIVEVLTDFLQMVRVGPQSLVTAIEQGLGGLSRPQRQQILAELQTEAHSQSRLQLLRGLMRGEQAVPIVQALEEKNAFIPLPAHLCVL